MLFNATAALTTKKLSVVVMDICVSIGKLSFPLKTHRNDTQSQMTTHSLLPHEARLLLLTTNLASGQIFAIGDDSIYAMTLAKHPSDAISDHYGHN